MINMDIRYNYLPTTNVEGEYWEIGINPEKLEVTVSFWPDHKVEVEWGQTDRVYTLPDNIVCVEFHDNYTTILLENNDIYKFKFEDNGCFIGDIFSYEDELPMDEAEFKDTFTCHDFYND